MAGYFLTISMPLLCTANLFLSPVVCGGLVGLKGLANCGLGTMLGFLVGVVVVICCSTDHIEDARPVSADLFPSLMLIGFCGSLLTLLTLLPDSQNLVGWLLITVCINDIAAYFVGVKVGGPKIAPVISPNKTVSGSLGGLTAGTAVGMLTSSLLGEGHSTGSLAVLCILVVVAAQLGDLSKSYLKRMHRVKDSGNLLPGHGGILDRIDGILAGSAILYFWLAL
jgi:phosphatidate cytidylyltransferase